MLKKLKLIPSFVSDEEERRFWQTHDSFDYVDWDNAVRIRFPNLKLSSETEDTSVAREKAAD